MARKKNEQNQQNEQNPIEGEIILYTTPEGNTRVECILSK